MSLKCNVLISVLDTIIQVANGVESHVGEILLVNVVCETSTELDSKLALHVCQLEEAGRNGGSSQSVQRLQCRSSINVFRMMMMMNCALAMLLV